MKKLLFLFFFVPLFGYSQYFDLGISVGTAYYIGDLNTTHFNPNTLSFSTGFHYRVNFNDHYSTKSSIYYAKIKADDSKSKSAYNLDRNLNFYSNILEASQTIEFNFLPFEMGNTNKSFTPYIFVGIAVFKFAPKSIYLDNTEFDLNFIGTEGQTSDFYPEKTKYKLTEISYPFGVGIKANISRAISCSFQWGIRKTKTDYLDDVGGTYADINQIASSVNDETIYFADKSYSTTNKTGLNRGDSKKADWYNFTTFTFYFSFGKKARYSCFSHKNH